MDLVHSHYVRNLNEGINELDGTDHLYSPAGPAGDQPHWDSKLFDYGKPQVEHFLLSNIKYWLEEYRFDGFRFDGVTSMLYHHHGYVAFDSRDRYFDEGVNEGAITYLSLANRLAHDLRPSCVTIAEDVSGMPGICFPQEEGGVGFDYRLGMAIPDYWIKQIEEVPDEQWDIREMWSVMTDRLPGVKTVAYAESHDQALVGDKTIAFRLMDKEMYTHMDRASENLTIDRGMALHKMIRLMTVSTGGDAYLNFMGNEFGHPNGSTSRAKATAGATLTPAGSGRSPRTVCCVTRGWGHSTGQCSRWSNATAYCATAIPTACKWTTATRRSPFRTGGSSSSSTGIRQHRSPTTAAECAKPDATS